MQIESQNNRHKDYSKQDNKLLFSDLKYCLKNSMCTHKMKLQYVNQKHTKHQAKIYSKKNKNYDANFCISRVLKHVINSCNWQDMKYCDSSESKYLSLFFSFFFSFMPWFMCCNWLIGTWSSCQEVTHRNGYFLIWLCLTQGFQNETTLQYLQLSLNVHVATSSLTACWYSISKR